MIQKQSVVVAEIGNFTAPLLYVPDIQSSYRASENAAVFKECCGILAHHTTPATEEKSRQNSFSSGP